MLRNPVMLWTLSVGFELMELTFQHLLPNFNECWWDRRGARRARSREAPLHWRCPERHLLR
jgi:hypothetical protein